MSPQLKKAVVAFRGNFAKVRTASGLISFMMTAGKTFLTRYIVKQNILIMIIKCNIIITVACVRAFVRAFARACARACVAMT